MKQDIEFPTPDPIFRIRQEIAAADLIWIFSPVYIHAIPGPVKNLLDSMSRSLDEYDSRSKSILYDKLVRCVL
ncbi:NAD(P)H-dependent FMN reductase [Streptococcus loxodontisalivarius]|uniref:NAD(P)H-dependent FMN reductase n=2 Tax=Streptococcus loxodontisalivarius TaxID=1349415 RepID=A0ABS2PSF1_9STRE|nr:NAD(P)H-dependent FMN reductase [Streptococcus loxodontisalivarius]